MEYRNYSQLDNYRHHHRHRHCHHHHHRRRRRRRYRHHHLLVHLIEYTEQLYVFIVSSLFGGSYGSSD